MSEQPNGFAVRHGEGERLRISGAELLVIASGATTGGAFAVVEENEPLDTPLHVHEREDELFFVLEGEHVFRIGEEELRVGPGAAVFAPRRMPHAHRRAVPRTGRVLTFVSPPGLEAFFRELAEAEAAGEELEHVYARVSERYGITWLPEG